MKGDTVVLEHLNRQLDRPQALFGTRAGAEFEPVFRILAAVPVGIARLHAMDLAERRQAEAPDRIGVRALRDLGTLAAQADIGRHVAARTGELAVDVRQVADAVVARRFRTASVRRRAQGRKRHAEQDRLHPTAPSSETSSSFFASTANSIGSSRNTCLQKPSTIIETASSSPMPRLRQ